MVSRVNMVCLEAKSRELRAARENPECFYVALRRRAFKLPPEKFLQSFYATVRDIRRASRCLAVRDLRRIFYGSYERSLEGFRVSCERSPESFSLLSYERYPESSLCPVG
ncbi:hypothetical protein Nepgr_008996 [Nepenthes gracilis]|uniref:Uncharacterized protein n=1 Tax=Nepenthes gracilis TaxID=150966 RepID=A0AAD3XK08_NEPGR|nr:hypothetical protein Nepgr_008996 [Nepenthes gracilis]